MPKIWELVPRQIDQRAFDELVSKLSKHREAHSFPAEVMDNVPPKFLLRCQWSSSVDGCIAFRYKDGEECDIDLPAGIGQPTYQGLQPKRVAFIGKTGIDPGPGAVIKTTCGHRMCINQMHLEQHGFTQNQFTN